MRSEASMVHTTYAVFLFNVLVRTARSILLVWQWDKFEATERGVKTFFAVGMTVFIVFGLLPRGTLPVILPIIFGLIALKLVLNVIRRKKG